ETWEAGLVLTGTEVKSLRARKASLTEAYAHLRNGEVWLEGLSIAPYAPGSWNNPPTTRSRKLLLHKNQIRKLIGTTSRKGLTVPLGLTAEVSGGEAAVRVGGVTFVFELGAPFVRAGEAVCGLVAEPYLARDTLFLPLVWLTDCLPRAVGGGRYRWDADAGRLAEAAPLIVTPVLATTVNPITGLRLRHTIVVDPGHGGRDPGNPGRYFSGSLTEKDITLAIGRLLRAELTRRGLTAVLT